ncbi:hypothetical protein BC332_23380 [Capsicum chinense]|nr:hypothetical protein BC332_23380 [Capsicum chinense]
MIDNKYVVSQVQELQVIIHDLLAEGMILTYTFVEQFKHVLSIRMNFIVSLIVNEAFLVEAIIEKLPPMWKDFKNYLKHKCIEMSVEDLIVRLCIEENNKVIERRSRGNSAMNEANIVEDDQNNFKKRKKAGNESNQPKKKFKGKCFNFGKIGHKSIDCSASNKEKKNDQANLVGSKKEIDDLCAKLSECNLVGNPREWWMDSGATHHIYANKNLFSMFTLAQVKVTHNWSTQEYWPKPVAPVCIHCDIQAAIGRERGMMYNAKSRHISWRHNTIRELLSNGIITVNYVKSKDNRSDPLIKGLSREGVERTSKGMGLRPRTSQHGGNST